MPRQKSHAYACLENWYGASSLCLLPHNSKKKKKKKELSENSIMPRQKSHACLENWYGASSLCSLPHTTDESPHSSNISQRTLGHLQYVQVRIRTCPLLCPLL